MLKAAAPAKPAVNLILCDEILLFYLHTVRRRESFLLQKQVVKLRPQLLFWHDRTESQIFLTAF